MFVRTTVDYDLFLRYKKQVRSLVRTDCGRRGLASFGKEYKPAEAALDRLFGLADCERNAMPTHDKFKKSTNCVLLMNVSLMTREHG